MALTPKDSMSIISESSKDISSFNFDVNELNVSIDIHNVTPVNRVQNTRGGESYTRNNLVSTGLLNSKSTNKLDSSDKDQVSVLASKNLLKEFDRNSDSAHKKYPISARNKNFEYKPRTSPKKSRVVVNKIRLFDTKFKSKDEAPKQQIEVADTKDMRIKEICSNLTSKHQRGKPVKYTQHSLKYRKIQYKTKVPIEQKSSRNIRGLLQKGQELNTCRTVQNLVRPSIAKEVSTSSMQKVNTSSKLSQDESLSYSNRPTAPLRNNYASKLETYSNSKPKILRTSKVLLFTPLALAKKKIYEKARYPLRTQRQVERENSIQKHRERGGSVSVYDRLMSDVKRRQGSSYSLFRTNPSKSRNNRGENLSVRSFIPENQSQGKLKGVIQELIRSETHNNLSSKSDPSI